MHKLSILCKWQKTDFYAVKIGLLIPDTQKKRIVSW